MRAPRIAGALFTSCAQIIAESDASFRCLGHFFDHLPGDEATRVELQGDAELQELIDPHLTLPIEDVPETLAVYLASPRKFCDAYISVETFVLYRVND